MRLLKVDPHEVRRADHSLTFAIHRHDSHVDLPQRRRVFPTLREGTEVKGEEVRHRRHGGVKGRIAIGTSPAGGNVSQLPRFIFKPTHFAKPSRYAALVFQVVH